MRGGLVILSNAQFELLTEQFSVPIVAVPFHWLLSLPSRKESESSLATDQSFCASNQSVLERNGVVPDRFPFLSYRMKDHEYN